MKELILDPGSFRDPKGQIYLNEQKVYRRTNSSGKEAFESVRETGLLSNLEQDGKIVTSKVIPNHALGSFACVDGIVIEHEKIPFISYPYEWSFSLLKSAALLHLEIHIRALDFGVTLSDASAYNIQFRGTQPVFIDILSFRKLKNGEPWQGHRQFCEQFFNPLIMKAKLGLNPNAWYRGALEGITAQELNRILPWHKKLTRNILVHIVAQAALQNASVDSVASEVKNLSFPLSSYRKILTSMKTYIAKLEPKKSKKNRVGRLLLYT